MTKRKFPLEDIYTLNQAQELSLLSRSLGRQIGLLIDRKGKVQLVLSGDPERITIPPLEQSKKNTSGLRGLRLLHTHLQNQGLSQEDLMDLLFLRLDAIACLCVDDQGLPTVWQYAKLDPVQTNPPFIVSDLLPWTATNVAILSQICYLENELSKTLPNHDTAQNQEALLISVANLPQTEQNANLEELAQLATTAGFHVGATLVQRSKHVDPRVLLGKGKMAELEVLALEHNAATLIFDGELTPAQLHNLADLTERRVLDRTQIILDIFAKHATSKAGKLQVELAQLRYLMPRLTGQNRALDRLMGGIGGRGKGETKLETDRRQIKERMTQIRAALKKISRQRAYVRSRREHNLLPLVAIVGYTNAGKSTLLNQLCQANVLTQDKLFATLDPVTRRLRFPHAREIIIADTIGFIRNLPQELMEAFQATLEELAAADALIHLVDAADPNFLQHIQSVEDILRKLNLQTIPTLLVFNKWDRVDSELQSALQSSFPAAIKLSAVSRFGLKTLEMQLCSTVFKNPEENISL